MDIPLSNTSNTMLTCAVCQKPLKGPITLSCGYTICKSCLPLNTEQKTFVCPVQQCTKQTHLFGPTLLFDQVVERFIESNYSVLNEESFVSITQLLTCPIGLHCLEHPITTHCGHTFCKLCLLQFKISNDTCKVCQKRLPSYQFIQHQDSNHLLSQIISAYHQLDLEHDKYITSSNRISNNSISFSSSTTTSIPILLFDFPILPSQKLWIPIYQLQLFLQSLMLCKEFQCLCFAILKKDKANHKNKFGTIVKVNNIKTNDVMVQITGLDRFQVNSVHQETDDFLRADITIQCERFLKEPEPFLRDVDTTQMIGDPISLPPSPTITYQKTYTVSSLPSIDLTHDVRHLATLIHEYVDELARSAPSNAFCSSVEGLLGPVWLESVQAKYGQIPPVECPRVLCWWTAIVLPVGPGERDQLLQTDSLASRLRLVIAWINDMKSTWIQCRQTAIKSALRAGY